MHSLCSTFRSKVLVAQHQRSPIARPQSHRATRAANRCRAVSTASVDAAIEELVRAASAAEPTFDQYKRVKFDLVQKQVEKVRKAGHEAGVDKVDAGTNMGEYRIVLSTDTRGFEENNVVTLSRMTFGSFGPPDLKLRLNDAKAQAATGLVDHIKGPWEGYKDGYIVYSHYTVLEPGDGTPKEDPLLGYATTIAEYKLPGPEDPPNKLGVTFKAFRIGPAQPQQQLQRWLQLIKPHNPKMDDKTGVCEVVFDKAPAGALDFLVMTDTYQVSQGNLGSVVVIKRKGT